MTEFIYKFTDNTYDDEIVWENDITSDEEALIFAESMDYTMVCKEEVSTTDCVVGWMYYNDEEDYKDACGYTFNTLAQLDNYVDHNGAGGHFSCDRIDIYQGGELVETRMMDERISCMNNWGEDPNEGDNLSPIA